MNDFGGIYDMFRRGDQHADKMRSEFLRLATDPCNQIPEVGDRVVVAIGLLGMGHEWIREEAVVLELGSLSYRVAIRGSDGTRWIHPALVTDVIRAQKQEAAQ